MESLSRQAVGARGGSEKSLLTFSRWARLKEGEASKDDAEAQDKFDSVEAARLHG